MHRPKALDGLPPRMAGPGAGTSAKPTWAARIPMARRRAYAVEVDHLLDRVLKRAWLSRGQRYRRSAPRARRRSTCRRRRRWRPRPRGSRRSYLEVDIVEKGHLPVGEAEPLEGIRPGPSGSGRTSAPSLTSEPDARRMAMRSKPAPAACRESCNCVRSQPCCRRCPSAWSASRGSRTDRAARRLRA